MDKKLLKLIKKSEQSKMALLDYLYYDSCSLKGDRLPKLNIFIDNCYKDLSLIVREKTDNANFLNKILFWLSSIKKNQKKILGESYTNVYKKTKLLLYIVKMWDLNTNNQVNDKQKEEEEITRFISKNEQYFKDNHFFLSLRLLNEYVFYQIFNEKHIKKEKGEYYLKWTEDILKSQDNKNYVFSNFFLMFLKAELLHKLGKKEEANQTFIDFFKKAFRYGIENTIKLYRFIPITTNSIYSISEKAIYLNHPNNWNDPFDCNLYDEAEEHFRRARMTCFSHSSNDEEPWQNILMWGHYANSHKGICLEFEFNFKEGSNYHLHKVEYKDSFNNFEKSNAFKFKAKNWEYENEYRLCYYGEDSDTSNPHKASWEDVGLTLKSIYFGVKTTEEDVILFEKVIKNIDFYRVQKDKNAQFKIAREELKMQDSLLFAKLGINQ